MQHLARGGLPEVRESLLDRGALAFGEQPVDDPADLDLVIHGPVGAPAEQLRVLSEQPCADRVKRCRSDVCGELFAEQFAQPQSHL